MTRVPTYANYMNLLNTSMKTKSMVDTYSYQATTGIKYANYAGYGMTSSNIVSMEASLNVTQNFMTNNVNLNTTITAQSTIMETIEDSVSSFKSQLNNALSALSDLTDGKPINTEAASSVTELQTVAYSAMSLLSDGLNNSVGGKYIFGAGSSSAPTQFKYSSLEEFQSYYDGINIKYPTTDNAALANRVATAADSGKLTISKNTDVDAPDNGFILSAENGFLSPVVTGSEATTGDLTLSALDNTLKSDIRGAFNSIGAGDTLILNDGAGNQKAYIVDSVSTDGKTITFSDETPVQADATYTNGLNGGNPVTISTSFTVGSVVNFSGSNNVSPTMQVVGIKDNGDLLVTADPSYFPADIDTTPIEIPVESKWEIKSESYYVGGSATEVFRVSDNQSITMDISANDSVFDKLFRAFGMIAQGNMIQTDDDGNVVNADEVNQLVNSAMDLLQSAIDNNGKATSGKNETMSVVIAKISANYVTLNNVQTSLEAVQSNLEDSVYSIKNVDKTEATVKLLAAQNSLEASYQVLTSALNLSLLNYID
ncbi:MAG: hypothetical protein E7017_06675 [Alphaproteobacteria bacterium]|nr:hypothetical protein [Alphaproteobacteria bacterium]